MDKFTLNMLKLAVNPKASTAQLEAGIDLIMKSMEAERIERERQIADGTFKPYTPPTVAELRRAANKNLAARRR